MVAAVKRRPEIVDAEWTEVTPARRRGSPPVTASEFASWSWQARAVYVVLVAAVVVGGAVFAKALWGLFPH